MALTFDDIYRQQGVQLPRVGIPGQVNTFEDLYGPNGSVQMNPPAQGTGQNALGSGGSAPVETTGEVPGPATPPPQTNPGNLPWDYGQSDLWNLLNGRTQSQGTIDGNGAFWNPNAYNNTEERQNAWIAAGRPNTDYMGRTVTGQTGGGTISYGGQQLAPGGNAFTQVLNSNPANFTAPRPPAATTTGSTGATTGTTAGTSASGTTQNLPGGGTTPSGGLGAAPNTTTAPGGGATQNQTNNQQVVGGQLNADLSVSSPRRRVANAMIVRR